MSVLPNPVDTGRGLQGVINQVAEAKTDIVWLIQRLQSRPIAVDIRHYKNTHRQLRLLGKSASLEMARAAITPVLVDCSPFHAQKNTPAA
jgi:hypothetical protein